MFKMEDVTPRSRSPPSPYNPHSPPLYEYPSPAPSDSQYRSTDSLDFLRGLELFSCQMPKSSMERGLLAQSPSATNSWPTTGIEPQCKSPTSSQSTPNILSAEYDPFASFHPADATSYSHDLYSTQTAEAAIPPVSPVPSCSSSHRSSSSSARISDIFTEAGSIQSCTSRITMDDDTGYNIGAEGMMMSLPELSHNLLVASASSYPGSIDSAFYPDQNPLAWPKVDYNPSHDLPSISSLRIPSYVRRFEHQYQARTRTPPQEQRAAPSIVAPARQPRKLTSREDANFQCSVEGCGKLFGRSYNYKAHMETHDTSREYPFPCQFRDCSKKFVRKTDLQRHHQSVHMKQRNHKCNYCSRDFARKDTLRRHMEDGCSKRFDLETVDFKPQKSSRRGALKATASRSIESQPRQQSCGSSVSYSHPPSCIASQLTSAQGAVVNTREYITDDPWPSRLD